MGLLPGRSRLGLGPGRPGALTAEAIESLPKGLKAFYKAHQLEMPDALPRGRPTKRTGPSAASPPIASLPFPFADLPRTEAALKERFPDADTRSAACPG